MKQDKILVCDIDLIAGSFSRQHIEFFNAVQMLILVLDIQNRIVFSNHHLLKTLNLEKNALLGKPFFEVFSYPLNHKLERALFNPSIHTAFPPHLMVDFKQFNRQKIYLEWKTGTIWDAAHMNQYIVCLGENISKQKKVQDDVQHLLSTLERHIDDRTIELETLYSVATIANESLEPRVMLEKMLSKTINTIGVPCGAIHLFNSDQTELDLITQVGIAPDVVKRISSITPGFGLTGWMTDSKHPLTLTNVSNDPRILSVGQVSGYSQYLSAAISSQEKMLGVISIFGDTSKNINPERVALLTTIADQIGVALERSALRQQAEINAVIEERQRVARELHDSVTQSLYSLTLLAAAGQRSIQDGSLERATRNLEKVGVVAFQTLKEMRLLVYELQPSTLTPGDFAQAIQRRLEAVEEHAGMQTRLIADLQTKLSKTAEIELYGLAQEALNNAIKHSGAASVNIHLYETDDSVVLEIEDNGSGFNLECAEKKHGAGLSNMGQRIDNLNGQLDIQSQPGRGTKVIAKIPKKDCQDNQPAKKDLE